jgi:hypothetical protein
MDMAFDRIHENHQNHVREHARDLFSIHSWKMTLHALVHASRMRLQKWSGHAQAHIHEHSKLSVLLLQPGHPERQPDVAL